LEHIRALNQRPAVDAILVQLPLPPHIDTDRAIQTIDPTKDVDGLHPINQGKLLLGDPSGFCPCTPAGILALLSHYKIDPQGKHVVIAGRSNIVGKPLAALLMQKRAGCNATVTLIHSASTHIEHLTKEADILIIAIGKRHWLKAPMVKEGAIVIDVGINQDEKPNIVGDVDFDNVAPKCAWITPVPGGVGPMTIAMLMHNTVRSYENRLL
jgi:methylenetetrahydrofolate dehydrogenase (NADP+)/methenyltetrahydrofolate cyclohydrolase